MVGLGGRAQSRAKQTSTAFTRRIKRRAIILHEREREIHKGGHLEITSTYVRIQACLTIHTYVSTYMQVHTYVRMYLHAYMYVCMHNIPIVYIRIKQNDTHMAQGFQ